MKTVILVPRGAARAPILLTRTPYGAASRIAKNKSSHLAAVIEDLDVADDAVVNGNYIRVVQDVRGKHDSEGDYVMNRPLQGPLNPTPVDHATDTCDTIDWLVKNVPESAGEMARLHGLEGIGFSAKVMQHPAYDEFWAAQAMDRILAARGVTIPVMLVHSLWDQEDIYGNIAVYKALRAQHAAAAPLFLVIGPWFHHQERLDGSHIGAIEFGADSAAYFWLHLLRRFLDHFLRDDAPPLDIAPVTASETGTNRWLPMPEWPDCAAGSACTMARRKIYLQPGGAPRSSGVRHAGAHGAGDHQIFFAKPADYPKATIKLFEGGHSASFVELPVAQGPAAP